MSSVSPKRPEKGTTENINTLIIPLKVTLKLRVYPRRFKIVPEEKREELVKIIDDLIARLEMLINAKKTKTNVRLRAMAVLNELIRTSYDMIRDVDVEKDEREVTELEEKKKQTPQGT